MSDMEGFNFDMLTKVPKARKSGLTYKLNEYDLKRYISDNKDDLQDVYVCIAEEAYATIDVYWNYEDGFNRKVWKCKSLWGTPSVIAYFRNADEPVTFECYEVMHVVKINKMERKHLISMFRKLFSI